MFALSPELGTSNIKTTGFFIDNSSALKEIVSENFKWIKYAVEQLLPELRVTVGKLSMPANEVQMSFKLENTGLKEIMS